MATPLKKAVQVWKLVQDLGIRSTGDPVSDVIRFCENRVKKFLKDFPECKRPEELLDLAANKLRTVFEIVRTDADLFKIRDKYVSKGERIFATLAEQLPNDVFGITFRLSNREPWEPEFASVIDCRETKMFRAYFTKWHELAHLLVLTDQLRLSFRRTACSEAAKNPEESLMDVIAGRLGYFPPMVRNLANERISFEVIERLRQLLCPESSELAARINFVKTWQQPCMLVHAELNLRANDKRKLRSGLVTVDEIPSPELRAIQITPSEGARNLGLKIFPNMRIPERSVIHRVFDGGIDFARAAENLSWWKTSDGTVLPDHPITIEAIRVWNTVYALIVFEI